VSEYHEKMLIQLSFDRQLAIPLSIHSVSADALPRLAALGWREGSSKSVDSAIWLEYAFEQDAATDQLVQSVLGPKG
jgi:hypothetical protein